MTPSHFSAINPNGISAPTTGQELYQYGRDRCRDKLVPSPESFARALRYAGSLIAHLSTSSDRAEAVTYLAQRANRTEALVEQVIIEHAPDSRELRRSHADRSLL